MVRAGSCHRGLIPAPWYVSAFHTFKLVRASLPLPTSTWLPLLPATLSQLPLPVPTAVILNIYHSPHISHPPPVIMASAESCLLIHRQRRGYQTGFFLRLAFLPTQRPPASSPAFPFPLNCWAGMFLPPPKAGPSSLVEDIPSSLWPPTGPRSVHHSLCCLSPAPSFPAVSSTVNILGLSFLTPTPTESMALILNPL